MVPRGDDELNVVAASIMIRVLIAGAQFLAEVPTNEQGYPATTVSAIFPIQAQLWDRPVR